MIINDDEGRKSIITKVTVLHHNDGDFYDIRCDHGVYHVDARMCDCPEPGMSIVTYTSGDKIRGLLINDVVIFYVTARSFYLDQFVFSSENVVGYGPCTTYASTTFKMLERDISSNMAFCIPTTPSKENSTPIIEETSAEWLANRDAGHKVWSVNMGGMGHGYEACIQNLAAEMIRVLVSDYPDAKVLDPENVEVRDAMNKALDEVADRLDERYGFSGAQVGAARNLAVILHRKGPRVAMSDPVVKDRLIQVKRS